ncbi:MAG TPA: hypothetical protein VMM54_12025 [Nitrospirota bacterium]|nr:hypothetical protein [Nitrospirota bacterium]
MVIHNQKTAEPGGSEIEKKPQQESSAGAGSDDICRCKEVAVMKPHKLLGLMIRDLAFWKKAKKG